MKIMAANSATPVVTGHTCDGAAMGSYGINLDNRSANLGSNGFLYVDNIQISRAVAGKAFVSALNAATQDACVAIPVSPPAASGPSSSLKLPMGAKTDSDAKTQTPRVELHPLPQEWEILKNKDLVMAPNPAKDQAGFYWKQSQAGRIRISMFNLIGQTVWSQELGDQSAGQHSYSHSLDNMAFGIYFIVVEVDSGQGYKVLAKSKAAVVK